MYLCKYNKWNVWNVNECVGISNDLDNVMPEEEIYIFVVKKIFN